MTRNVRQTHKFTRPEKKISFFFGETTIKSKKGGVSKPNAHKQGKNRVTEAKEAAEQKCDPILPVALLE